MIGKLYGIWDGENWYDDGKGIRTSIYTSQLAAEIYAMRIGEHSFTVREIGLNGLPVELTSAPPAESFEPISQPEVILKKSK